MRTQRLIADRYSPVEPLPGSATGIGGQVRALGGLQHDRLARTMDVVLDADDLWVASELLPGVTMVDELARGGAVGPEEVARCRRHE